MKLIHFATGAVAGQSLYEACVDLGGVKRGVLKNTTCYSKHYFAFDTK